jgi:hypothetical protein
MLKLPQNFKFEGLLPVGVKYIDESPKHSVKLHRSVVLVELKEELEEKRQMTIECFIGS